MSHISVFKNLFFICFFILSTGLTFADETTRDAEKHSSTSEAVLDEELRETARLKRYNRVTYLVGAGAVLFGFASNELAVIAAGAGIVGTYSACQFLFKNSKN